MFGEGFRPLRPMVLELFKFELFSIGFNDKFQNGRHDKRKLIIKKNFGDVASPSDTEFFQCIRISVYLIVSEFICTQDFLHCNSMENQNDRHLVTISKNQKIMVPCYVKWAF